MGYIQSIGLKRVGHDLVTKPKPIEMITTSMMKRAKNSSFSLTCLSFMCSFGDIFQQLRERKTERVFKERVLFLALVYLTICGGWGRGGGVCSG